MKVLFLMFSFPHMDRSHNMFTTLVEHFYKAGHDVMVVAPGLDNSPTKLGEESGVSVLRVKTLPIKNVHHYIKGLTNIFLPYQFKRSIRKFLANRSFDLIISATPPITLVGVIAAMKRKHQAKFYLVLRDIFPQNAIDMGFMKKDGVFHQFFRKKEIRLYAEANHIGCMSEGNVEYITKNNPEIDRAKLHILENFQRPFAPPSVPINLRSEFQLEGKFVVVFGGNMGKPQQLENVLELAYRCTEYQDVVFLLLGEGVHMERLKTISQNRGITNIRMQSTIPKSKYQQLISQCDLGLISLHEAFTIPNIPSKTLDYFNVGLPVLASIDRCTDYGNLLDQSKAGLWCFAGEHEKFKLLFDRLYKSNELRKEMGENGHSYFQDHMASAIAYQKVIDVVLGNIPTSA